MVVVRSSTIVMSMPAGMEALIEGSSRRTRSTVSMMFAPGWRKMMTVTARLAVQIAGGADVLHRVVDVGDVGQPHRRAVVVADDQRPVVLGMRDLVVGDDVGGRACHPRSGPCGWLAFCRLSRWTDDSAKREPVAVQLRGIHLHAHRRQRAAAD